MAKKKKQEKDELERIQNTVTRSLERAINHYDSNIEPDEVEAEKYYQGKPFGDEEEGRSKVVSTDVRDAILQQMPSLLRIFLGSEDAVEFRPRNPEDVPVARQQTDYINYVIRKDNPGFTIFHGWFKSALKLRLGIVKWWWDEFYRVTSAQYEALGEEEILALMQDEGFEDAEMIAIREGAGDPDPMTGIPVDLYDIRVTRREKRGCPKIALVPTDEFVYTPEAKDLDVAPFVAHVRPVPVEELIALGIDEDLIEEALEHHRELRDNDGELAAERQVEGEEGVPGEEQEEDDSQKKVLYAEAYVLIDGDGDKVAERRLFQCVGPKFKVANGDGKGEIVDEVPFAVLTPELEPHTIRGLSNFDLLKDVQRVKSQLERGMLDSLALAIEPKLEVVEGEVNMADVLSPAIDGVYRVYKPGMMREIAHTFLGAQALDVIAYQDEKKENRTGQTKAAAGLDADSLQSSTKAAVAATLSAAQQRTEMIARTFAETGVKRLFQGLLALVVRHQDRERMVRLRNEWVPVDPRYWDAEMDVEVNVALGQGSTEDKVAVLGAVAEKIEAHIQNGSPLGSISRLRNVYQRILEAVGEKDIDAYFPPFDEAAEEQMKQQAAQQPQQQDPAMMLVQIEQMKAQTEAQIAQMKLQLEQWKAERQDDRERDKIAREMALKEYELELKHTAEIEDAQLKAKIAADRAEMDAEIKREQIAAKPAPAGGAS